MSNVTVQNGQLPNGFCPSTLQEMLNGFSAAQFVSLAASASQLVVASTPPADHTVAWLQLDSSGRPVRTYYFAQGAWLSLHPLPPGFGMMWNQGLPDFTTFDGGDNNGSPFSALSGQMWQLMATTLDGLGTPVLAAQFPVGVGTFTKAGAVALAGTGGEDQHVLTQDELAPHFHKEKIATNRSVPNGGQTDTSGNGGFVGPITDGGTEVLSQVVGGDPNSGNPPTVALGHNNLPPFYGLYFLQRTNRLFYLVNA